MDPYAAISSALNSLEERMVLVWWADGAYKIMECEVYETLWLDWCFPKNRPWSPLLVFQIFPLLLCSATWLPGVFLANLSDYFYMHIKNLLIARKLFKESSQTCITFFCGMAKKIFWRMLVTLQFPLCGETPEVKCSHLNRNPHDWEFYEGHLKKKIGVDFTLPSSLLTC